jgi:hypothetical protein
MVVAQAKIVKIEETIEVVHIHRVWFAKYANLADFLKVVIKPEDEVDKNNTEHTD